MKQFFVIVVLSNFLLPTGPALAHAMLDHANPRVGSSQPKIRIDDAPLCGGGGMAIVKPINLR
jgi:hypothetical protein